MDVRNFQNCRKIDLSQPLYNGMPHIAAVSEFIYTMVNQHGNRINEAGVSIASDMICTPTHIGTHIDALGHVSKYGCLHGGVEARTAQTGRTGLAVHGIEHVEPVIRRGVLLDIAAALGVGMLDGRTEIGRGLLEEAASRQNVAIQKGDIVLVRTGWIRQWNDAQRYLAPEQPGVNLEGMAWLAEFGIFACGSDTAFFEKMPAQFEVHAFCLAEKGIHIMENMNLEELSSARAYEFTLVVLPLKIIGATASPVRPVALLEEREAGNGT